ncbi:MAG: chitobiase/beta-hexosaminidase C-terminal domain-containing protein [Nocardioidaceae bacterium]|nr:chitobiase/beta-hexosaminidase C-terminal domain-containing protein [Nocardioidaceae bacterium]
MSTSSVVPAPAVLRRRGRTVLGALLAVACVLVGMAAPATAAVDGLRVGPVDPSTSYPMWVQTSDGTRLDLCLDDPSCLGTRAALTPPDGEAFWYNATATVNGSGATGLVEMATEAAFAAAGPDQQMAFNRLRIRLDVNTPGTYEVRYPYGTKTYVVDAIDAKTHEINDTQDIGCLTPPCGDFADLADTGADNIFGSFLRWDPAVAPAAPEGFLGDGLTEHTVVGSPIDRNYVDVVRVKDAQGTELADPQVDAHVTTFAVQGRIARPTVLASPAGGFFAGPVTVSLMGSEPDAQVWYTDDGSAPADDSGAVSPSAKQYTGPLTLSSTTTIKAVNAADGSVVADPVTHQPSKASSDTYTIDTEAPTLTATPDSGAYGSAPVLTLTANDNADPDTRIFYTHALVAPGGEDPADPTTDSTRYTGPVPVNGNADGLVNVFKAIAVDGAGNTSAVVRRAYDVSAPAVHANPAGGSYVTAQDVRLIASDEAARIYYTTDGSQPAGDADGNPADGSTTYTNDPIRLTGDTTLKFVAVTAGGSSTVITEKYLIDIPANRPTGALGSVSPVDSSTGYPFWFGDKGDTASGSDPVRLELCLDDPLCPVVGDKPDPSAPASLPDNFPDESFWWSAESAMDLPTGASALLVLSQEAAFGGAGTVLPDQQIAFARLRIRLDDVTPGETYTVTTPYGVDQVTADDRGRARMTEDIGCLASPCDFKQALDGRVGPFLRWDPNVAPQAPAGYIGNPLVEHAVVGSPHGTNFFRVEGPGIGGAGVDRVQNDLFTVQGRIAQLRATAAPGGDLYSDPQDVQIRASFPDEARIVYTTDGTEPTVDENGQPTGTSEAGPVPASGDMDASTTVTVGSGTTTLKYLAVDLTDATHTSQVYTETYHVDGALPTVTASPSAASSPFAGGQTVHLTARLGGTPMESQPAIYYTTDGTVPKLVDGDLAGSTLRYDDATGFRVGRPTTVKAFALSELGTPGPVATFRYVIQNLADAGPVDPDNGFPQWYQDYGDASRGLDPERLVLCIDPADANCPVVGALPDPTQPVSFPDNFPDEAFWWSGDATFTTPSGDRARLVLSSEAAFANGAPKAGDQIAFGRIRVRIPGLVPGATYRIVHPYGVVELTADETGVINATDDSGCLAGPCDFREMLQAPIGPFLRWDSGAPAGYVGDGGTPHTVVGSPLGTNEFTVDQVTDGTGAALAVPERVGSTDLFTVQGKEYGGLAVSASPRGGLSNGPRTVTLTASDTAATIRYTLDGTDPTADSGTVYDGPVTISGEGVHELRFLATDGTTTTAVRTEVYTIDLTAPTVSASPAGGQISGPTGVTLSSPDPDAKIFYSLDGSTPTAATGTPYTGPVTVG